MIITLDELNKCTKALPDPYIAREMDRSHWKVVIEPDMPVWPWYDSPDPNGPTIRIATFELKKVARNGSIFWRWMPCDDLII